MAPHSSPLTPAMMVYLAILYEHLAGRTLAEAAEGHCDCSVLPPPTDVMPGHVAAMLRRLDDLLCRVFRVVCSFRRANLAIGVVLEQEVARVQEDYRRLECDIEAAGDRVNQAETPEARAEGLWALFYLSPQEELLRTSMERSRQRLEVFYATCADPEPSDADDIAYEALITEIAVYLRN